MYRKRPPKSMQGILWSADVRNLDLKENRSYIVNQILSLGTLQELRWLFRTYSRQLIRRTFIEQPAKIYTQSSYNYCKNILLSLKARKLASDKYVKTLPRNIRQKKKKGL